MAIDKRPRLPPADSCGIISAARSSDLIPVVAKTGKVCPLKLARSTWETPWSEIRACIWTEEESR